MAWSGFFAEVFGAGTGGREPVSNTTLPNIAQVLGTQHPTHPIGPGSKVHPSDPEDPQPGCDDGACQRPAPAAAERRQSSLRSTAMGLDSDFAKAATDILTNATTDGLINKALISALFLTFNIPAIMVPPMPIRTSNLTFLAFFITAGLSIAAGFFTIISATFIATHQKAAAVSPSMAAYFAIKSARYCYLNHNSFLMQGITTSMQVAVVCYGYMGNHWAYWFCVSACMLSLLMVGYTKLRINKIWAEALLQGKDINV